MSGASSQKPRASTERGQLSALLRRERLYGSQLPTWRAHLKREGEAPNPPGCKPLKDTKDRRIHQLEVEKANLERELLIAEKLIELPKKSPPSC